MGGDFTKKANKYAILTFRVYTMQEARSRTLRHDFWWTRLGLPFANLLASISSRPQEGCISDLEIFTRGNTLNLPLHPNQRRLAHTPGKGWTHHGGRLYRRREGGDLECNRHTASPPPSGRG